VTPPSGIVSAVILLLQKAPDTSADPTATVGDSGCVIPHLITKTLTSSTSKRNPTKWNEASCSWPLLDPSGRVSSTEGATWLCLEGFNKDVIRLMGWWSSDTYLKYIQPQVAQLVTGASAKMAMIHCYQHVDPNNSIT
jgi:hypothetical protein